METATMAIPGHHGTPGRQTEETHTSTMMQRWSRNQHRLVSKRMGKFQDHILLSAFFTAFQLAFRQYAFAFDFVSVLPAVANFMSLEYKSS